jgi:hypothetical protein
MTTSDEPRPGPGQPSHDPTAVARLLVSIGEKLITLLDDETALLRGAKTAEIGELTAEKTRLSQIFAAGWRQFLAEPDRLDQIVAELRAPLLAVVRRLNDAAVTNEEALRTGRRAAELVLAAVARALQAQRPRPTYSAERVARLPLRDQAGIGLNRSA